MDGKDDDLTSEEMAELEEALYRSIHYGEHEDDEIIITPLMKTEIKTNDQKIPPIQISQKSATESNEKVVPVSSAAEISEKKHALNLTQATESQHLPTAITTTSKSSTTIAAKSIKATTTSTTSTQTSTTSAAMKPKEKEITLGKRVESINTLRDITQTALRKKGLRLNPRTSLIVAKKIAAGECSLKTPKASKLQKNMQKNKKNVAVVDLMHSDSDDNEVIIVPNAPSPIISIVDTDDDDDEEVENNKSARCASPGSVMSSDEFIESEDRLRLNQDIEVPPNDQDILDMTAGISSIVSKVAENKQIPSASTISEKCKETKLNVMVEETADFRAMDVYDESETDNQSVKQNSSSTKHITISDENDSDASVMEVSIDKVKRLRKRRQSEASNIRLNTTNNTAHLETPVPYISKGPAVMENYQIERKRTTSVNGNPMSDKTFINTLNNLAQGKQNVNESEDESDMENTPTAREIAEKVLARDKKREKVEEKCEKLAALPEFLESLKDKFESIDAYESSGEGADGSEKDVNYTYALSSEEDEIEHGEDEAPKVVRKEQTYNRSMPEFSNDGHGWTFEMSRFYSDSWQGNNQSINDIINKLHQHTKKNNWHIHVKDFAPRNRRKDLKCHNCSDFGHIRAKCKLPRKPLICFMCGEQGHMEPRCPNTMCLNCGKKSAYFTRKCTNCSHWTKRPCMICNRYGHVHTVCPDIWRRFRNTTEGGDEPVRGYKVAPKQKYCSACGQSGHYVDECMQAKRVLDYLPVSSKVFEYQEPYQNSQKNGCSVHLTFSLLYDPDIRPEFTMSQKTTPNNYYGRFLKSVGMSDALNTKKQQQTKSLPKAEKIINLDVIESNSTENLVQAIADALDSDSNYSFSENFPIADNVASTSTAASIVFKDALPEFIPFTDNHKKQLEDENNKHVQNMNNNFIAFTNKHEQHLHVLKGISKNFMPLEKPEEQQEVQLPVEKPVENKTVAKIFMNEQTAQFLTSDVGKNFLQENMKNCQVTTKIVETKFGRVIEVFGLEKHQDIFQTKLQSRVVEFMIKNHHERLESLQNVPKRVDAMIVFLRSSLNQLFQRLGSVQDLYKRQLIFEQRPTKSSIRIADKARRLLNMILIGQGGLLNGKHLVENLLDYLKELLRSKGNQFVNSEMRVRIGNTLKFIFTPYRYDNYEELMQQFSQLPNKNQLVHMNIDAMLLGRSVIKKNELIETPTNNEVLQVATKRKLSFDAQPPQKIKNQTQLSVNMQPSLLQQQQQQQQVANKPKSLKIQMIAPAGQYKSSMLSKPCVFWSKESIQYLKICLNVTDPINNNILHDQLERVLDKAERSLLSYRDYRAVIKLHTSLTEDVSKD